MRPTNTYFGAHHKIWNEDKPTLSAAKMYPGSSLGMGRRNKSGVVEKAQLANPGSAPAGNSTVATNKLYCCSILWKLLISSYLYYSQDTYNVSKKNPLPWFFMTYFSKRLGNFSSNFTRLLYVPIYAGLQIFIQLPATLTKLGYAILSATIICSNCPPSAETHAGWSHLIWHNFVTVGGNWIKTGSLA